MKMIKTLWIVLKAASWGQKICNHLTNTNISNLLTEANSSVQLIQSSIKFNSIQVQLIQTAAELFIPHDTFEHHVTNCGKSKVGKVLFYLIVV